MTKPEFKARLRAAGWTARRFAEHFGYAETSVSRWGASVPFPPWVSPVVELIEENEKGRR